MERNRNQGNRRPDRFDRDDNDRDFPGQDGSGRWFGDDDYEEGRYAHRGRWQGRGSAGAGGGRYGNFEGGPDQGMGYGRGAWGNEDMGYGRGGWNDDMNRGRMDYGRGGGMGYGRGGMEGGWRSGGMDRGARGWTGMAAGEQYRDDGFGYGRGIGTDNGPDYGQGYGRHRGGNLGQNYGENYGRDYGFGDHFGGTSAGGADYGSGRQGGSDRWGASDWSEQAARSESYSGRGPAGYKRSGDRITEDANEALTWASGVDASDVRVKVEGDEVTLEGTVDSRRAKRAAEEAVEGVRGVRDVHNRLRVKGRQDNQDSSGRD